MYDFLVAELRCPNCGALIPDDAYTNMQTHIRSASADGSALGVGFEFHPHDVMSDRIIAAGYSVIRLPDRHDRIGLLDVWSCPICDTEQWAMVTISGQEIQKIEAVMISRATLETASFISEDDAGVLAARYVHAPTEDTVEILRRHLP